MRMEGIAYLKGAKKMSNAKYMLAIECNFHGFVDKFECDIGSLQIDNTYQNALRNSSRNYY